MLSTCGSDERPCDARCLRAKSVIALPSCSLEDEVDVNSSTVDGASFACMVPVLASHERLVVLTSVNGGMRLKTIRDDDGIYLSSSVLYVGPRDGLSSAFLRVGNYRPRSRWLPVSLPRALETALFYMQCVSASMALLNMAPAYGLDGAPAMQIVADWLLSDWRRPRARSRAAVLPYDHLGQGRALVSEQVSRRALRCATAATTGLLVAVVMHKAYIQLL
mmetsp:Transcript_19012/g.33881  ORF Transcript_19012/g.33881 Transcript_19012/m.33881 type:complete len:220 (-) Transcript_19012:94-753(-)